KVSAVCLFIVRLPERVSHVGLLLLFRRIVPRPPTAIQPVSLKATATSLLNVPLAFCLQVAPPSVVRKITPAAPTAVPVAASPNEIAFRVPRYALDWGVHVSPLSVVRRITPPSPTANPVSALANQTP